MIIIYETAYISDLFFVFLYQKYSNSAFLIVKNNKKKVFQSPETPFYSQNNKRSLFLVTLRIILLEVP